jgi:ribosomal protein L3 glutamine methyltransferase
MSKRSNVPSSSAAAGHSVPVVSAAAAARQLAAETNGQLFTLRDWLRFATSLFNREKLAFGQGAPDAAAEAAWLLRHTLDLPREPELWAAFLDARLTAVEAERVCQMLARRAFAREPAAYITGEAWLGEFSFRVDPRVIIPRSYFLEIIPEQLNQWLPDPDAVARVADVCTGSGCLAVLLAAAYPNAFVDATDISAAALEVAALNIADYNLEDRVRLFRADVLDGVGDGDADGIGVSGDTAAYDIIVCNPPYEPEAVLAALPAEFRKEPADALVSGPDGMDVIRKLIPQAARRLAPNGVLLIELGGLHDVFEAEYPDLEINWLPTADHTDCVVLLHATALRALVSDAGKKRR